MSRVQAIKEAIESLPDEEYSEIRQWFSEKDWQKWDSQIETDVVSGNLDFLVREALEEKTKGQLKDL